ncbi:MAG: hypothetical protein ACKVS8_01220 [Phycisphaerales bacterium]
MTFRGEYRDGVIVPDAPLAFPDGTRFVFAEPAKPRNKARQQRTTAAKRSGRPTGAKAVAAGGTRRKPSKSKTGLFRRGPDRQQHGSLLDLFRPFIGRVKGLPRDFAVNHDHYLYGVPKREP